MPEISLILFDDAVARDWEPFALTRPVGELMFGTMTLRRRAERALGLQSIGYITASHLAGFEEEGAPPVLVPDQDPQAWPRLYLLTRFVPDWPAQPIHEPFPPGQILDSQDQPIGWYSTSLETEPPPDFFLYPESAAGDGGGQIPGRSLERVWELISGNPDQIGRDIADLFPVGPGGSLPVGCYKWGSYPLIVDESAQVEPGSAFDTSGGPIWIDRNARVQAFTRLAGPSYIGEDSRVLGGAVEAVSIGPVCRIHGELAESVCLGYVNKQHDGHMGHAYLGRWVNLGAETTNSDLKNNYGAVRVWTPRGETDTGEIKMGSLIGDHVKTGIGTLLNTGTVIGAGSNLYGTEMPPKYVPAFSWGTGTQLQEYRLENFLQVAERSMSRRNVTLSAHLREQLERSWKLARSKA